MSIGIRSLFTLLRVVLSAIFMVTAAGASTSPVTETEVTAIEPRIQKGEPLAVRQAFDLSRRADGAVSERLDIALGAIITQHPRLFLEELRRSGRTKGMDSLLGNLGPRYVDRFTAQAQVLQARAMALQSVAAPELDETRLQCLQVLRPMIEQLSEMGRAKG